MAKQFIAIGAILLLSLIVVISMTYAQHGLMLLVGCYDWVADNLTQVFSGGAAGNIIRQLIALLIIPFAIALVPVIFFWFAKRRWFPYFMEFVWVTWLIQTTALIYKG